MVDTAIVANALRTDIERTGYYPALVSDCLATALGGEPLQAYSVHHEATFDRDELRRHITVLALTATKLIVTHVDEHGATDELGGEQAEVAQPSSASASTETVRLRRVDSVIVTRVVSDPAGYVPGSVPDEVVMTIGWGAVSRIDLEPATCGDPQCDADHGLTGAAANDDLTMRVSAAADGRDSVSQLIDFAESLSRAMSEQRQRVGK
ncbi:MAG: DUF5998 family protein [Actinomycetes bacterium]